MKFSLEAADASRELPSFQISLEKVRCIPAVTTIFFTFQRSPTVFAAADKGSFVFAGVMMFQQLDKFSLKILSTLSGEHAVRRQIAVSCEMV
jgi:hypothetical protein